MRYTFILLMFGLLYVGCNDSDRSKAVIPPADNNTVATNNPTPPPPQPTGMPLRIETSALPDAFLGQPYDFQLQASGGTPPYTWSTQPGQGLPSGLNLDPATGRITGMPTAAVAGFVGLSIIDTPHNGQQNSTNRDLFLNVF